MFWGYYSKMVENQTQSTRLEQRSLKIFYGFEVQTMWNLQKECDKYGKASFRRNIYKWVKHEFVIMSQSWKDRLWSGNIDKENVLGAAVNKDGDADSLLGHERTHHFDFLEKGAILNRTLYYQLLWQNSPYLLDPYLYISSSCCTISTDIPDPLPPPLSSIAFGRSSGLHPISTESCPMYVQAGRSAFAQPCEGVHKSTLLMSSSLLLQQCPAYLVHLILIVFVIGGRWPYSCCFVGCCLQDLFNIARSILV